MNYFLYILKNPRGKIYIGYTVDTDDRLKRHRSKQGAYFVWQHKGFELVYTERYNTQLEAMRREKQLKGWTRAKKEALIKGDQELLKKL